MEGKDQIRAFDWRRLLMGKTPWSFLGEVAFRGLVIYVVLLLTIRMMGKRVAGQLSLSELAIMVTLGAAIGVPMEVPDNGLLPALVLLAVAVLYQRGIGWLSFRKRKIELLTQGDLETLVNEGVLDLNAMKRVGLSQERVFAALRQVGLCHLGEVQRLYLETSGSFSVFRAPKAVPGLKAVPPGHPRLKVDPKIFACGSCGTVASQKNDRCRTCGKCAWEDAVLVEG